MTDQQTVVDTTKTAAQPAVTDNSAPGDVDALDKLLAEYDQSVKPAATATPPETKTTPQLEVPPPIDNNRLARIEQRLFQEDLNEAVTKIFGDKKVPRRVALGWLDQIARENPAIAQAFMNKSNDPKTWERFAKSLSKEVDKDFKSTDVDENATVDREAVTAAVRGASSTKAPAEQPADYGRMPASEGRKDVLEKYGFDPGWR